MTLTSSQETFLSHALSEFPKEACAALAQVGNSERVFLLENIHPYPNQDFLVSRDAIDAVVGDGKLLAFWHSHTNGNTGPSQVDRTVCETMGVPWEILVLPQQVWASLAPCGYRAPLKGREWAYGYLDCYSLIRDAYRQFNIHLSEYNRPELFWTDDKGKNRFCWHSPGWAWYVDNFAKEGFIEVHEPRPYDVLLMKYRCENENHIGLMLPGGYVLHHMMERQSDIELWDGWLRQCTTRILRHQQFPEEAVWAQVLQLT